MCGIYASFSSRKWPLCTPRCTLMCTQTQVSDAWAACVLCRNVRSLCVCTVSERARKMYVGPVVFGECMGSP